MKTDEILNEREKTHGDFEEVAYVHDGMMYFINNIAQDKKTPNVLSSGQRLAINSMCLKIARIVCGNPNHADHWDDIAGYAMLGKGKGVIRQEDMPCTAKVGQKFIFENGEFKAVNGWGYCDACAAITQHTDGLCARICHNQVELKKETAYCLECGHIHILNYIEQKADISKMETTKQTDCKDCYFSMISGPNWVLCDKCLKKKQ